MKKVKVKSKNAKVKRRFPRSLGGLMVCVFLTFAAAAQTNGTNQIEKSVVAVAGGASAGGNYLLESTTGEAVTGGFLSGLNFSEYSGFWTPDLIMTDAFVPVRGGVLPAFGRQGENREKYDSVNYCRVSASFRLREFGEK